VEKTSAVMNIQNEVELPVHASHIEMCKLAGKDDDTYVKLQKRLRRIIGAPDLSQRMD
jgi:hypothetical protein